MPTVIAIVVLTILIVGCPIIVGALFDAGTKRGLRLLARLWAKGFAGTLALFELVYIPSYFLRVSYRKFLIVYLVMMTVVCITSLILKRSVLMKLFQRSCSHGKGFSVVLLLCAISAMVAIYVPSAYTHSDEDDSYYLATAVTTQESNSMFRVNPYTGAVIKNENSRYLLSPMPIYFAMLSTLSGMHVLVLAHRVFPVFCILLAFCVAMMLGTELFEEEKKQEWFLLFYIILTLWSGYSTRNSATFLLYRIWQGKAVLAAVLLPLIWAVFLEWMRSETANNQKKANWQQMATMTVVAGACGLVSSMGIFLAPVLIGILSLAGMLQKRSISWLWQGILCTTPCLILGMIYILAF